MNNLVLALFPREALAKDAGVEDFKPRFSGITLAQNVRTADEVHELVEAVRAAGYTIVKEPQKSSGVMTCLKTMYQYL